MSNKKRYQKIFVNDECVVDFTEQHVKAGQVCSGNTFFDCNGHLEEGQGCSFNFLFKMLATGRPNTLNETFHSPTIYLNNIDLDWNFLNSGNIPSSQWLEDCNTINEFRFGKTCTVMGNPLSLSSMSNYKSRIINLTFDKGNEMLDANYNNNTFWGYNDYADEKLTNLLTYACYIEDPDFEFPKNIQVSLNRGSVGCEFKTTEDGFINYIKTPDNKIYLKNLNIAALNQNSTNIYNLVLPDYIEDLPVVHICDRFFEGYARNIVRYSSIESIKFPIHLESISIDTLAHEGMPRNIELPSELKIIHAPFQSYYDPLSNYATNYIDKITLPDSLEGFSPICNSSTLLQNFSWDAIPRSSGSSGLDNEIYISTKTNSSAFLESAYGGADIAEFSIPEGCTQILPEALSGCQCNKIILPASLKYFSQGSAHRYTSWDNSYVQEVIFTSSDHTVTINPRSFKSWSALNNIILPNKVTFIPDQCFEDCSSLTTLTIPATVTYIGEYALKIGSSANKATITLLCTEPPIIPDRYIIDTSCLAKIVVPKGTINTYKQADNWSAFSSYFEEAAE